ncbi:Sulfotransferase 1C4 [Papilio machaon]|uniref:Sulfotransferase 1C4 n=1 Tax=Papilio machaon TaxID=76193 RepID=A0A0N1IET4_PAPMA|nr:Sulfotransferase 1C4 [Papilio machaon]
MAGLNKAFPFEAVEVDPEQFEQIKNYYDDTLMNLYTTRYGPKGYLFTKNYESLGAEIYNMELRPSDTFVVTFPKCGTTWTQELVWLIANDFNYEAAAETNLNTRFPFIESSMLMKNDAVPPIFMDEKIKEAMDKNIFKLEKVNYMSSPRFIKSHLPLSMLPASLIDTCKVVYVARDPRDVAVSFYHHSELMKMLKEGSDFKTYWNLFIKDLISWTPFFEHLKEAWQLRNHPNMLFLFYEELSKDLAACARRIAKFLNKEVTEEQIEKLCDHLKIDNFKKNKSVNLKDMQQIGVFSTKGSFIREGKVGGWTKYFDEAMTQQAEQWIEENLRDTDLRFPQ